MRYRGLAADPLRHLPWLLVGGAVGFACTAETVGLDGLPCGNEACLSGWVCHPETRLCVRPVVISCTQPGAVCPINVNTGDPCEHPGSFLNCADGITDCSAGCRTCSSTGTWSACSAIGCDPCTTYYRDNDDDGVGQVGDSQCLCTATPPYTATNDGDCDDTAATGSTCSTGCTTFYADGDGDGLGGAATLACAAPANHVTNADDCDDGNAHCTLDCTDGDGDDFCVDVDCNDGNGSCTDDCAGCPPSALELTVETSPPFHPSDTLALAIDLGSFTHDATAEISCWSSRHTIVGPITFTGQPSLGTLGLTASQETYSTAPASPADEASCSSIGDYVRLRDGRNNASLSFGPRLDAAGLEQLEVAFRAAVEDGYVVGDTLEVQSCCGTNCTPTTSTTVPPASLAAANACSLQSVALTHDDCANVGVRWMWDQRTVAVGLDDLEVTALYTIPAVSVDSPGHYVTSFTLRYTGTFDVTCRWKNDAIGPELTDAVTVTVE